MVQNYLLSGQEALPVGAFVPCTHRPPTARPLTGLDIFVTAPRPPHTLMMLPAIDFICENLLTLPSALPCRPSTTRAGTPPSWRSSPAACGCRLPSACSSWPGPPSTSRSATSMQPFRRWSAPSPTRECQLAIFYVYWIQTFKVCHQRMVQLFTNWRDREPPGRSKPLPPAD